VKAAVAVLALCVVAAGVAISGRAATGDPAAVARTYYGAYNTKDGKTMCRLFTPELSRWFTHLPGLRANLSCARAAAAFIGYGEESDTPLFRRLRILSVTQTVGGDEARVTIKARFNYKHFPKPVSTVFTDRLYLSRRGSSWQLVKPGGVWFLTMSAYNTPETMLDPPITDDEAHVAAPQPTVSFDCTGRPAGTVNDAAHDAPAPLDIRRAVATIEADDTVCLRVSYNTAPRPGTALTVRAEQHTPGQSRFFVTEGSVRIGHEGRLDSSLKAFRGGWRDGDLYIRFAVRAHGSYTLQFGGTTKTLQMFEPLVRNPLLGGGSEPSEGHGDSFGRPGS
jgi:hypothetical protein